MNIIEKAKELENDFAKEREWYQKRGWFTLYHTDYRKNGYTDQYGFEHWAEVIDFEVKVKFKGHFITESWGSTMQGIIVEDKDGNEYQQSCDATAMNQTWSGNGRYGLVTSFSTLTLREDGTRMDKK